MVSNKPQGNASSSLLPCCSSLSLRYVDDILFIGPSYDIHVLSSPSTQVQIKLRTLEMLNISLYLNFLIQSSVYTYLNEDILQIVDDCGFMATN